MFEQTQAMTQIVPAGTGLRLVEPLDEKAGYLGAPFSGAVGTCCGHNAQGHR